MLSSIAKPEGLPAFASSAFKLAIFGRVKKNISKLVITKGYEVRATTIEGQNAFALTLCFAKVKFSVIDGRNTCDQIAGDRRSKRES